MENRIIGVIPARFKSTRFPGKPLVMLLGKPMILWVAELSSVALGRENVYIATDDHRIADVVETAGFQMIMTSEEHLTGTDRIAEVATKIAAGFYINIQGDEPTIDPVLINQVGNMKIQNKNYIINAMTRLEPDEDPQNINIPKVITSEHNDLIYMSRLPVPGYKDFSNKPTHYFKQVCIYAYTKEELIKFHDFGRKSALEKHEDIEILRFLDLKLPVKMFEVKSGNYAVDVHEDIIRVEKRLKETHGLN